MSKFRITISPGTAQAAATYTIHKGSRELFKTTDSGRAERFIKAAQAPALQEQFKALEIKPCAHHYDSGDVIAFETEADADKRGGSSPFWTLYGRLADGTAAAIGDYAAETFAREHAGLLSGDSEWICDATGKAEKRPLRIFTEAVTHSALCVWEEVLRLMTVEDNIKIAQIVQERRENIGTFTMREESTDIAIFAESVWEAGRIIDGPDAWDSVSYDWELIPEIVRLAYQDSDDSSGPHIPKYPEDVASIAARLLDDFNASQAAAIARRKESPVP